nr:O-acyltransferase like protein isoform X3 [Misgurnus anguillicaudatus]
MLHLRWTSVTLSLLFLCHAGCSWNVSLKCMQDTTAFLTELEKETPSKYAVQMYDAFGKIGSDVEGGNVNRPGSLRECLSVRGPDFGGQYCQVFLKQDTVEYFVGICVPDSCEDSEVQTLVVYEAFEQGRISLLPPVPSVLLPDSTLGIFMTQCITDSPNSDPSAVVCLFVCAFVLALPLLSSICVALLKRKRQREVKPEAGLPLTSKPSQYGAVLTNGSANQNKERSETTQARDQNAENEQQGITKTVLSCLQAFSVQKSSEGVLATKGSGNSYSSLNGIRILSLLWIISGHTVQLSAWSNLGENMRLQTEKVLSFSIIHLFCFCVENDKRWKEMVEKNPFYVLAFSGPVYLAVDSFLLLGAYESYFQYYYNKPYTRYGPYLLGILAGIYLTSKNETLIKKQWQAVIGWFSSLSIMALLVGLAYVLREVPPHPSLPHAVYQGSHRTVWALALIWVILACEEGYGGFVDKILSLRLWVPLSNISFACYLIHPIIIILYNGKQETGVHYTDLNFFYLFLGHLLLTLPLGFVLTVLIEKPYLFLMKSK